MSGERGSALVVAMLLMTLFLMLGGAFLATALGDGLIAANQVAATRALHLAEAGLEHARATLDAAAVEAALDGDGWLLSGEPLGTGSYSVRVTNNLAPEFPLAGIDTDPGGADDDTDGYVVLTATGEFRRASRSLRIVVRRGEDRPWAGWNVFGSDFVSAQGSGSFLGSVASNHDITLRSSVVGDAEAGGVVNNPHYVSGSVNEGLPRVRFPVTACPESYGPAPSGSGVTFDPISGDLTIEGPADVVLDAGSYHFNKIFKSGSGKLVVEEGDAVELYVKSDMMLEGATFDTRSGSPGDLVLYGCSESAGISAAAPEWRIAPDHPLHVTVYAPTHRLRLYGDGDKIGVFVGKSLYKIGRGDVVFMDGGAGAVAGGVPRTVPGTWSAF